MDSRKESFYGDNIYENWHCVFPFQDLSIDGHPQKKALSEPRIEQLSRRINLEGKSVLELGCLEGLHSLLLQSLGARKIIAIEGRKENFLKCLIVKNAFNLDRCKFLYGDLNKILPLLTGPFDICLSLGVFYHLENPLTVIYRIAELAKNLFVWTHFSTENYPKGHAVEIKYQNGVYRGKYVGEDTKHYLSGLRERSFWFFEDEIFKATKDAGFKSIDLITKEQHEHGPAMLFLAHK